MKPNSEPENEERLDRVLRAWTVDSPLPPRFQEQVWQRVERAENRPELTIAAGFRRLLEIVLPRPKVACTYLAILLALGIVAGAWTAQVRASRLDADLSLRYVQSLDPYRTSTE
jgi:hypothetical protein